MTYIIIEWWILGLHIMTITIIFGICNHVSEEEDLNKSFSTAAVQFVHEPKIQGHCLNKSLPLQFLKEFTFWALTQS